jgi:thiamine pyrophosphate-dependent acetolactate synthase large subunit-like protein
MAKNASDILIETLINWNVDTIFGMPGDGINGIMEALRTRQQKIRFIQVRHEEAAALMACGYAKFTCGSLIEQALATPGPVIFEAVVDPFEPPMAAKVTASQAAKFAKALMRGQPHRNKIALTVLSDKVRELV